MLTLLAIAAVSFAASPTAATVNEEVESLDELEAGATMGKIMFDSRLPAEIRIDNQTVAQLYLGARLTVNASVGQHEVMVLTNGVPRTTRIQVTPTGAATVVIGRTGLTTGQATENNDADGSARVEFRVAGDQAVLVQLEADRYRIDGHGYKGVEVPVGSYKMSVRSGNGTVVWATGRLELHQATDVVVQLAEGRMPEVSGGGSSFFPGS